MGITTIISLFAVTMLTGTAFAGDSNNGFKLQERLMTCAPDQDIWAGEATLFL
jgi:hypothetical protein